MRGKRGAKKKQGLTEVVTRGKRGAKKKQGLTEVVTRGKRAKAEEVEKQENKKQPGPEVQEYQTRQLAVRESLKKLGPNSSFTDYQENLISLMKFQQFNHEYLKAADDLSHQEYLFFRLMNQFNLYFSGALSRNLLPLNSESPLSQENAESLRSLMEAFLKVEKPELSDREKSVYYLYAGAIWWNRHSTQDKNDEAVSLLHFSQMLFNALQEEAPARLEGSLLLADIIKPIAESAILKIESDFWSSAQKKHKQASVEEMNEDDFQIGGPFPL